MNQILKDKQIVVLYGGKSSEREVSLRSGKAVYDAITSMGYKATLLDATDDLCLDLKRIAPDLVFIALHGGHGENGAIQGLLEVLEIPYTGSGRLASALAMDKERTKTRFLSEGIKVAPYVVLSKKTIVHQGEIQTDLILNKVDFPFAWVVKPVSEGSSIGVHIIHNNHEIRDSVSDALDYDERIIIEKYIKGREIQVAILRDRPIGGVEVRPSAEFYDYKSKYTSGMTEYIIPPDVPQSVYEQIQEVALKAHLALGCKGATRVDLILSEDNEIYALEVNTIPGMTATSLLPKIAQAKGMSFERLIEEILLDALENRPY